MRTLAKAGVIALGVIFGMASTASSAGPLPGKAPTVAADSGGMVVLTKAKKGKKKVRKAKGKKKGKQVAKSCGTFKYRKGGKCMDARDKK